MNQVLNYYSLKNIRYKTRKVLLLILVITILSTLYVCRKKVYSTYITYGQISNDYLELDIEYNSDIIAKSKYLVMDNKQIEYQIISVSKIYEINYEKYQKYQLKIHEKAIDNTVKKITFLYDEERIINKIFKTVFK